MSYKVNKPILLPPDEYLTCQDVNSLVTVLLCLAEIPRPPLNTGSTNP